MNTTIDQMLTNVYELEGLLLVIQRHNDNIPQLVIDRFKEKAQQITAAASLLDSLKKTEEIPQSKPVQSNVSPPVQPEKPAVAPSKQPAVTPPEHPSVTSHVPHKQPIFAPSAPIPPSQATIVPPPVKEPVIEPVLDTIIEPVPDNAIDSFPEPVCDTKPIVQVEEPFAPQDYPMPDITAAFTINDRFLFQRELFDGDKQKYADAISVMQRLANIDKIKGFMTDVLGLDTSNDVVKEFMRLIELGLKG
ncbi:MAG: hypothetical protein IKW83_03115 [Muribaculaceae bacterium]|nr:hypothetical protein [Muribaculaceae bacterium]